MYSLPELQIPVTFQCYKTIQNYMTNNRICHLHLFQVYPTVVCTLKQHLRLFHLLNVTYSGFRTRVQANEGACDWTVRCNLKLTRNLSCLKNVIRLWNFERNLYVAPGVRHSYSQQYKVGQMTFYGLCFFFFHSELFNFHFLKFIFRCKAYFFVIDSHLEGTRLVLWYKIW